MELKLTGDHIEQLKETFKKSIPFWESFNIIARYQRDIAAYYKTMFMITDPFQLFQLVPTYLSQVINPWSFLLMAFTKEVKGTPATEYKILKEVAGYGSQLGTIMDYLNVVAKSYKVDLDKLSDEDKYRVLKFRDLGEQIEKAKG